MQPEWGLVKMRANSFGTGSKFRDYQMGFDAGWELDFWGKFRRDVEAAHASLIASVADYDDALVSLTAEVARTYTVIRTFEVLIELTSENVKASGRGATDCRVSFPQWRYHGTGCNSGTHIIREYPGYHSPTANQPAAVAKRLEHAVRAADRRLSDIAEWAQRDSDGTCRSGRQRTSRTAATAAGYPQRRTFCRCTVCPHWHCQS